MSCITDPVADFLTRIRNSARAGKRLVEAPHSRLIESIGRILKDEGFVDGYSVETGGNRKLIRLVLKYTSAGCVINGIRRESRPGLRKYVSATSVPRILSGMGISILSTSSGVMSSREARRKNVGGEFLAAVW